MSIKLSKSNIIKVKEIKYYFPLIAIELFLLIGILLYLVGPWKFPYSRDPVTLLFLAACHIAFIGAYIFAINKGTSKSYINKYLSIQQLTYILIVICLIIALPYCHYRTGYWLPRIDALSNLSLAYGQTTIATSLSPYKIFAIGYFFEFSLFCVIYYYLDEINNISKFLGFSLFLFFELMELSTGRNRGVVLIAVIILVLYCTKLFSLKTKNKKTVVAYTCVALISVGIAISYYGMSMISRGNHTVAAQEIYGEQKHIIDPNTGFIPPQKIEPNETDNNLNKKYKPGEISPQMVSDFENAKKMNMHPYYYNEYAYAYVNMENPIFKILPEKLQFIYATGSYYVSHGYHGLSIGLRQTFEPSYGLGHLMFLHDSFKNHTGIDIYARTFVKKVNQMGYPISLYWGTAYLQFASDISFGGVILLMGLLGWLLASLWIEALFLKNIISIILLPCLTFNLLMITSWWQAGMSGSEFIVFYGCLFIWIFMKIYNRFFNTMTAK